MSSIDNIEEEEVVLRRHQFRLFRRISTCDISSEDETQDILFPLLERKKERLNSENNYFCDETEHEISEDNNSFSILQKTSVKLDLKHKTYQISSIWTFGRMPVPLSTFRARAKKCK